MSIRKKIAALIATGIFFCSAPAFAGSPMTASGEASEDMIESTVCLASASAPLSGASVYLSGSAVITAGHAVPTTVLDAAEVSGDAVVFSGEVLVDGLTTTAMLSRDLTLAGVDFSADSARLVADAAGAGIHLSVDTAELFLDQAAQIAAASGRLSGETAELAVSLAIAGVTISADSTRLVADAAAAGIEISEDAAENLITASLAIAAECIETAVITERYVLMTLEEANRLLREASVTTVRTTIEAGRKTYTFSRETAGHLQSLGIDAGRFAAELSRKAATATVDGVTHTVRGANDAIVVVINTGSGLVVASLDSITEKVESTTAKIQK